MRTHLAATLAALGLASQAHAEPTAVPCASLEACLRVVSPEDEVALADRLASFGSAAIAPLVKRLKSSRAKDRNLAGLALTRFEVIGPEHLPALIKADQSGNPWTSRAIARLGGPAALTYLTEKTWRLNWIDGEALNRLGASAVPLLLRVLRCERPCTDEMIRDAGDTLRSLGERAHSSIPTLLAVATDEHAREPSRAAALHALGGLGPIDAEGRARLRSSWARVPDSLLYDVGYSLTEVGDEEGTRLHLERMLTNPQILSLREVAALGRKALVAGPRLVALLASADADVVLGAARALGFIEYAPAAEALLPLLSREDDWRLAWAAAESLGRLRAADARAALERLHQNHWFPRVTTAAATAIAAIDGAQAYPPPDDNFAETFFAFEHPDPELGPDACPPSRDEQAPVFEDLLAARALGLKYDATIGSTGPDGRHERHLSQKPDAALRVGTTWLLGASRGEWGGELVSVDAQHRERTILRENVLALVRLGPSIVAVTGLAHLFLNHGRLYRVAFDPAGLAEATPWRTLPGAPDRVTLLPDGRLRIAGDDGTVLVAASGAMEFRRCH